MIWIAIFVPSCSSVSSCNRVSTRKCKTRESALGRNGMAKYTQPITLGVISKIVAKIWVELQNTSETSTHDQIQSNNFASGFEGACTTAATWKAPTGVEMTLSRIPRFGPQHTETGISVPFFFCVSFGPGSVVLKYKIPYVRNKQREYTSTTSMPFTSTLGPEILIVHANVQINTRHQRSR